MKKIKKILKGRKREKGSKSLTFGSFYLLSSPFYILWSILKRLSFSTFETVVTVLHIMMKLHIICLSSFKRIKEN